MIAEVMVLLAMSQSTPSATNNVTNGTAGRGERCRNFDGRDERKTKTTGRPHSRAPWRARRRPIAAPQRDELFHFHTRRSMMHSVKIADEGLS